MKFTQYLLRHLIPAWVKLYLNFKLLKTYLSITTILKTFLLDAKQTKQKDEYKAIKNDILMDQQIVDKLGRDNLQFLSVLEEEVEKVYTFALFKYQDLVGKFDKLKAQVMSMELEWNQMNKFQVQKSDNHITWNITKSKSEAHQELLSKQNQANYQIFQQNKEILHNSFFRLYVEVSQLLQYIEINNEAARKIIKKYKKQEIRGIQEAKADMFDNIVMQQKQIKKLPKKLNMIKDKSESLIIAHFYRNENPKKCRENLRRYTEISTMASINVFFFGFFAGFAVVFVMLLLLMRYDGFLDPNSDTVFNKVFPCFRGMALYLVYYWVISFDLAGWKYFNINYKLYLGFNYHSSTLSEVWQRTSIFSAIYLIVFVLYCTQVEDIGKFAQKLQVFDPRYYPLIIWSIVLIYVFYPTKKYFNPKGRKWMYDVMYGCFWGHFFAYESRYTFFADQLCSMTTPMRDLDYTICYYYFYLFKGYEHNGECEIKHRFTSALPATLPYSIKCIHYITRARQKGKFWHTDEMWNFFKTLNAVNVGVLSYWAKQNDNIRFVWIFFAIVSTCWQYWWDLKKDFLFFEPNSKYKFLRNDLGYNSPAIYYLLAVVNLFLRATWVLSISPDICTVFGIKNELFILLVGTLEMMRRFLNNFLKMEKEHITNLRTFKAVQDLKYPFKVQSELCTFEKESAHWSVSSFQRENSGFRSLEDEMDYKNCPNEILLYRGLNSHRQSCMSSRRVSFADLNLMPIPITHIKEHSVSIMEDLNKLAPSHSRNPSKDKPIDIVNRSMAPSNDMSRSRLRETIHDNTMKVNINTSLLDKVKKTEILEMQRITELKQENRTFKKSIEQAYIRYRVSRKEQ